MPSALLNNWLLGPAKLLLVLVCLIFGQNALAHDVDVTGVARIFLDQSGPGSYRLSIVDRQVPPLLNFDSVLPQRCQDISVASSYSYTFNCHTPLNGDDQITLPWSLEGVVVVARWSDGSDASAYFRGTGVEVSINLRNLRAESASAIGLARQYLISGAEHILFGFDHLLFVFGLLLLMQGTWPLIKTITAFTIAHSITLGLAVLGVVNVASAPVEAIIALSIVLLGREIITGQRGEVSQTHKRPWMIAFIFGLVHGLGFAGALGELGLRNADVPLALLFFNLGVELGQLGFVAAVVVSYQLIFKHLNKWLPRLELMLAYGLGGIAMLWFLERLSGMLPA